jgi:hypothetical protein
MAKKTKKKPKQMMAMLSPEEMVAGIRRSKGHLPTKASEAVHKKRKKRLKGATFE